MKAGESDDAFGRQRISSSRKGYLTISRFAFAAILSLLAAAWTPMREPTLQLALGPESRVAVISNAELAEEDLTAGRHDMAKGDYAAAYRRFKSVIMRDPNSKFAEESLARLTDTCLMLGLISVAREAVAVLRRQFPKSRWYLKAHDTLSSIGLEPADDENSWISRAYR
jgi:outer membrane protein assembly factor BamD